MWRDNAYLLDMLIAARHAREFLGAMSMECFRDDAMRQSAIVRQLGIIGEAAVKVSEERRRAHPEIPWTEMIGMRNRLVHEYKAVDVALVWQTVRVEVPRLEAALEPLIPAEDEPS